MFNKNLFKAQMVLAGVTSKQLAESLNINESTLYRKIQSNGSFTREEIKTIVEVLDIKDPIAVFFAE